MSQPISGSTMGNKSQNNEGVESLRREYTRDGITENSVHPDPVAQFSEWFEEALESEQVDANAMTLATATATGKPSCRIVLIKGFDTEGFRFYTNYDSRKGKELEENPYAALCFYWPALERQVRIEGKVEKISREKSAEYFRSRPRVSQIGAWASSQSSQIENREELEKNFKRLEEKFEGREVPLPDFWGGYLLRHESLEFWQGRAGRLHDRILYTRSNRTWNIKRLSP